MSNTHEDHEFVIDELTEEDFNNHNPKIINNTFPLSPFCDMRKNSMNLVFYYFIYLFLQREIELYRTQDISRCSPQLYAMNKVIPPPLSPLHLNLTPKAIASTSIEEIDTPKETPKETPKDEETRKAENTKNEESNI